MAIQLWHGDVIMYCLMRRSWFIIILYWYIIIIIMVIVVFHSSFKFFLLLLLFIKYSVMIITLITLTITLLSVIAIYDFDEYIYIHTDTIIRKFSKKKWTCPFPISYTATTDHEYKLLLCIYVGYYTLTRFDSPT